jgi:hypothetical protein
MDVELGVKRNVTKIGMKVQKGVYSSINNLITYYVQIYTVFW